VLAALAMTVLAACGTKELSSKDVAKDVQTDVLAPRGVKGATVTCPKKTKAEKGKKVKCSVRGSDGSKGTVTATVKDEDGNLGAYKPDLKKVQLAVIEKNASEAGRSKGISGKVNCPTASEPKKGALYFCTANISGSGFGVVILTQTNTAGDVSVRVQKRKLRTRQIEASIRKELTKQGITATVSCPSRVTSQKGSKFSCRLKAANGRSATVVATQKDSAGNFSLKVKK
jgi:hypothetical protein